MVTQGSMVKCVLHESIGKLVWKDFLLTVTSQAFSNYQKGSNCNQREYVTHVTYALKQTGNARLRFPS